MRWQSQVSSFLCFFLLSVLSISDISLSVAYSETLYRNNIPAVGSTMFSSFRSPRIFLALQTSSLEKSGDHYVSSTLLPLNLGRLSSMRVAKTAVPFLSVVPISDSLFESKSIVSMKQKTWAGVLGGLAIASLIASVTLHAFDRHVVSYVDHTIYDTKPFYTTGYAMTGGFMIGAILVLKIP